MATSNLAIYRAGNRNCQKYFRWASNLLSRSVSSVTGNNTAVQRRSFFVITTVRSDGCSLRTQVLHPIGPTAQAKERDLMTG
jgi:hypothetical protein